MGRSFWLLCGLLLSSYALESHLVLQITQVDSYLDSILSDYSRYSGSQPLLEETAGLLQAGVCFPHPSWDTQHYLLLSTAHLDAANADVHFFFPFALILQVFCQQQDHLPCL